MFGTRVVLRKRLNDTLPGVPLPLPLPPQKKTSTPYPKTSAHQISHHQCTDPRIDSLVSRAHISIPLATAREQRPYRTPNRNVTYVIKGSRSCPHQEPHPSKQARSNIPPPNAIRPRVRVMDQGYPLTGPSPGTNPPIYPSSLSLPCGNLFSNIFPKSHGIFFLP